jgi:hypothetical protein
MCGHNHPTMRNELGQRHVLGSSWRCNRRRGGQVFCCRVFSYSCNPWIHKVLKSSLRLSAFAEIGKCFHIHHIKIRLIDLRLGFIYLCFVFIWTSILIGRGQGSGVRRLPHHSHASFTIRRLGVDKSFNQLCIQPICWNKFWTVETFIWTVVFYTEYLIIIVKIINNMLFKLLSGHLFRIRFDNFSPEF